MSTTAEESFATHRLPFDEAPRGYEMFHKKRYEAMKVLLKPWDRRTLGPHTAGASRARDLNSPQGEKGQGGWRATGRC